MPNEYARAVHELVQAKIEQRAPEVEIESAKGEQPKVINIMDALKKSMQARGQATVKDAVRKRMGKAAPKRSAHRSLNETIITPDCALAFTSADKLPTHLDAETTRPRVTAPEGQVRRVRSLRTTFVNCHAYTSRFAYLHERHRARRGICKLSSGRTRLISMIERSVLALSGCRSVGSGCSLSEKHGRLSHRTTSCP